MVACQAPSFKKVNLNTTQLLLSRSYLTNEFEFLETAVSPTGLSIRSRVRRLAGVHELGEGQGCSALLLQGLLQRISQFVRRQRNGICFHAACLNRLPNQPLNMF